MQVYTISYNDSIGLSITSYSRSQNGEIVRILCLELFLDYMLYWGGIVKKLCDGGGHFEYKCSYIQYRYSSTLLGLYGVLYWISSPQKHNLPSKSKFNAAFGMSYEKNCVTMAAILNLAVKNSSRVTRWHHPDSYSRHA